LELMYCGGSLSDTAYQERRELAIRIMQMLSRLCGPPR
jgi:hypothetical protein